MSEVLCRLEEIPDGAGRGFEVTGGEGEEAVEIVVVRQGDTVYGYVNSCPHVGTPLNWVEDRFMSLDGKYILCATHGACFRIADGYCVAGPCRGESLTPVRVAVREGQVVLCRRPDIPDAA